MGWLGSACPTTPGPSRRVSSCWSSGGSGSTGPWAPADGASTSARASQVTVENSRILPSDTTRAAPGGGGGLRGGKRDDPLGDLAGHATERGAVGGDVVLPRGGGGRLLEADLLDGERAPVGPRHGPARAQRDGASQSALELEQLEEHAVVDREAGLGGEDRDARRPEERAEVVAHHAQDVGAQRAAPAVLAPEHEPVGPVPRHDLGPVEIARELDGPDDQSEAGPGRQGGAAPAGGARRGAQRVEVGGGAAAEAARCERRGDAAEREH